MRLGLNSKSENAHEDAIWCATWSDEKSFVTGSVDETVKVWQLPDLSESIHTYTGHTLGAISVAADKSGTFAASSALDSFIRVWNLQEATTKSVMETPPSETWALQFHPTADEMTVVAAAGSSGGVTLWGCENADKKQDYKVSAAEEKNKKEKFTMSVACSPDGKKIACGSQDGSVVIFDSETGSLLQSVEGHFKPVRSLTFTPDSRMLLTGCDDMQAHLYDTESGSLIEAFSGHTSWVLSVDFHPSGSCFATGSSDSNIKLWDFQSRSCVQTLSENSDQVWGVAFSRDGQLLGSVSDDKTVSIYNYTS